jgi:hypothetical protein
MSDSDETRGTYVKALVFEAEATPQQRNRNYAFYLRIRDGVDGDHRQSGLKSFVFEVPVDSCSGVGNSWTKEGMKPHFSFRLDPESDCYRRLCSYIVGHTDAKCDADDEAEKLPTLLSENAKLKAENERMRGLLDDVCERCQERCQHEGAYRPTEGSE